MHKGNILCILVICSVLFFLPSSVSAQNPKGYLTFGNCTVGFFYPQDWKDFISDNSDCEQSYTEIKIPQPSLSEKMQPSILIQVENCCEYVTSRDETGYSAIHRNVSLEEYVDQKLNGLVMSNYTIINSGPIILGTEHPTKTIFSGHKIVAGFDSSGPTHLAVYVKNGTKMATISYQADPSDYHTYLPGLQKIADSFNLFVS